MPHRQTAGGHVRGAVLTIFEEVVEVVLRALRPAAEQYHQLAFVFYPMPHPIHERQVEDEEKALEVVLGDLPKPGRDLGEEAFS